MVAGALALGFIIYIDLLSHAPVWSIYMEMVGIFLAFLTGLLYLLHHNKKKRGGVMIILTRNPQIN